MSDTPALSAADVAEAYAVFLDREPESQSCIEAHMAVHTDRKSLFRAFAGSEEHALKSGRTSIVRALDYAFFRPPARVDHEVGPEVLQAMFERIRAQWALLGEQEPYWSVLSVEAFRAENMDEQASADFWATGAQHASYVDHFARTTGRSVNRGTCLELGCGVGRITRHLAAGFERVIGVDISRGNLNICENATKHLGNVETRHVTRIEDFEGLPDFDFFYSLIVLQHNPPPVQKAILRILFSKVRPGGGVLFQIPTDMAGYGFDADSYLGAPITDMEMHGLPRPVVLAEMRRAGLDIVDVIPDACLGEFGSFTFYGVRPG